MNERERIALDALKSSKKYGGICPQAVDRIFAEELNKHAKLKDADKSARARLHQITGAFMTPDQLKKAGKCLDAYVQGDESALQSALKLHASTAERIEHIGELYAHVFEITGKPALILDLACGLNPLYLGSMGLRVIGYDISGDAVALVNAWAEMCKWAVRAEVADLSEDTARPPADLTLMMKLLPVLEQQRKGAGMALLSSAPSHHQLTTFPTRTLSGRGVGMELNYTRWFEDNLPDTHRIIGRFVIAHELCYITEDAHA